MTTAEIAETFEKLAVLLELKGENPFRVRAFQSAAAVLEQSKLSPEAFAAELGSTGIKGFGPQLKELVFEYVATGSMKMYGELQAEFPPGLLDLLKLPGLGPKKLKLLYRELNVASIDQLAAVCADGTLAAVKGFGAKTVESLRQGIEQYRRYQTRMRLDQAERAAEQVIEALRALKTVRSVHVTGELRRCLETVAEIDLLICTDSPENFALEITSLADSVQTISDSTFSFIFSNRAVRVQAVESTPFAAALLQSTGGERHLEELNSIAEKKGIVLTHISEEEIYSALGLRYVPPELRENEYGLDQLQCLADGKKLIELNDIRGVVHCHTTYSDGKASLREMALAVRSAGYLYLGVSDHSQSATYAGGLKPDAIRAQHDEIDRLNQELAPFVIFKGIESDILADGSLDYPDAVLETFDFIIASLHSQLSMDRAAMRNRMAAAAANPYTTIIGHPTARLLLKREGAAVEIPELLEAAAESGTAVEINANPRRLDLDWRFQQRAKELGILMPICPDAHSIAAVDDLAYGVKAARKGGLTANDVPTAWDLAAARKFFCRKEKLK